MLEKDIEGYAVRRARQEGWFVRKLRWIGCDDAPDRFFAKDSEIFLIEFKKPGEPLRPGQEWEHRELRKHGIEPVVIDSREAVDAFFEGS
jgi:hypothetical protein